MRGGKIQFITVSVPLTRKTVFRKLRLYWVQWFPNRIQRENATLHTCTWGDSPPLWTSNPLLKNGYDQHQVTSRKTAEIRRKYIWKTFKTTVYGLRILV